MVCADDWIYPNCLEEMVALAETDPQIALVGAYHLNSDAVKGAVLACGGPDKTTSVVAGRDACRLYFLDGSYVFGVPNAVLYRTDLVRSRDSFFPDPGKVHFSDSQLCFEILESKKFGFVQQILSYTRQGNVSIGTSLRSFCPGPLLDYVMTKKYGRCYLEESEYRRCLARAERHYYLMLAYSLFHRRGPDFWQYQAGGLELVGERLDWGRIVLMQLPRLFNLMGNPKRALEVIWERLRSKKASGRVPLTNYDARGVKCDVFDGRARLRPSRHRPEEARAASPSPDRSIPPA